jgi:hypothetical protein
MQPGELLPKETVPGFKTQHQSGRSTQGDLVYYHHRRVVPVIMVTAVMWLCERANYKQHNHCEQQNLSHVHIRTP